MPTQLPSRTAWGQAWSLGAPVFLLRAQAVFNDPFRPISKGTYCDCSSPVSLSASEIFMCFGDTRAKAKKRDGKRTKHRTCFLQRDGLLLGGQRQRLSNEQRKREKTEQASTLAPLSPEARGLLTRSFPGA